MTRTGRAAFGAALLLALSACLPGSSAYLAQTPGAITPADTNAPVNQRALPGVIEYDPNGNVAKERADAYRQMTNACHGPYRIESEGPQLLEGGRDASPTWVIHFVCVAADSATTPHD